MTEATETKSRAEHEAQVLVEVLERRRAAAQHARQLQDAAESDALRKARALLKASQELPAGVLSVGSAVLELGGAFREMVSVYDEWRQAIERAAEPVEPLPDGEEVIDGEF